MDIRAIAVAARHGLDMPKRDPLRFRRLTCMAQRHALEWIVAGHETYWHAGNAGSKTEGFSHLFMALCRALPRLDGRLLVRRGPAWVREWDRRQPGAPENEDAEHWITLPGLREGTGGVEAWRHWVLVQSYDQAKDSSMRAYRKLVGRIPHETSWLAKGLPKRIRVKPDVEGWSDDPETWSEITFISQEGMTDEDVQRVQGARVHSVHCDEMPLLSVYEEILNRADANTPLLIGISATPEYKHEWEPILERFKGCYGRPVRGRVHIQSSVEDNRALSLKDLHGRWKRNRGIKLFRARWDGEHVDIAGGNPFPEMAMKRLLAKCQSGRLETIVIRGEPRPGEDDFRDILPAKARIERWRAPDPFHSYVMTVDTSRGIDDGAHDPCELQVWDWHDRECVCRFGQRQGSGGYLDEDSLAILADHLGREYCNALIDPEVAGNFGVQFILTLRKLRYPNIAHDDKAREPDSLSPQYGWNANPTTNGENVSALIQGLNDGSFNCWSADMVTQWMDVREDEHGRPANVRKGARHHREAMVCAGRALHVILNRTAPKIMAPRKEVGLDAALRRDMGHPVRRPGRVRTNGNGRTEIFRRPL